MTVFKVLLYGIIGLTLWDSSHATTTSSVGISSYSVAASPSVSPTASSNDTTQSMSTSATITTPGVSSAESASSSNSTSFIQSTISTLTTSNLSPTVQSSGTTFPNPTPTSPVSSTTTPTAVPPSTTKKTEVWDKAIDLATPMGTFIIVIVAVALVLILLIALIIVCCKYIRLKKRTKFPDHVAINDNDWIRSNDDLLMWERNLRASEVKSNNGISNRPFNEKRA